jgi:branched-chain amino acid transport system permease protein
MNYALHLVIYFDIFLILALSLNLIVGYTGLLSLAHAGFFAIGAYAYALLSLKLEWGFFAAAFTGAAIAALTSLTVSLCSWRLKGDFFVMGSLAVQALIYSAAYNWNSVHAPLGSLSNLTNGPFGISAIPRPHVLGLQVASGIPMALLATFVGAISSLIIWWITGSSWGKTLVAMRDDELAARGLGKNTKLLKLQAIAIGSAFAAIAGAVYAAHVRYVDPSSAALSESILILSMVIVGGLGNFRGPIVGAAILVALPEILRTLSLPDAMAANLRLMLYGLLLVLLMLFRPQGVCGEYRVQ